MNEKQALDYASDAGLSVSVDYVDPKTKEVSFRVGRQLKLTRDGQFWIIGDTGVKVHRRGNALKYAVDFITGRV